MECILVVYHSRWSGDHAPRGAERERTMAIVVLAAIGTFALFAAHVVYVCVRAALAEGAE